MPEIGRGKRRRGRAEKERDDGWTAAEWHDLPRRPAERPTGCTTWFCMCTPPQEASAFEEALEARCAEYREELTVFRCRIGHRPTYHCSTSGKFYEIFALTRTDAARCLRMRSRIIHFVRIFARSLARSLAPLRSVLSLDKAKPKSNCVSKRNR